MNSLHSPGVRLGIVTVLVATCGLGVVLRADVAPGNWCQDRVPVPYHFTGNVSSTFRTLTDSAAAQWTNIPCDFAVYPAPGDNPYGPADGVNSIEYAPLGTEADSAITQCSSVASPLVECDMVFNSSYTWSVNPVEGSQDVSILGLALHEFGHWVKLAHGDHPDDVMNEDNVQPGEHQTTLSAQNIADCSLIYPIVPPYAPWRSPPCTAGTCCALPGLPSCIVTDQYTCASNVFDATSQVCDESSCPEATGACCYPIETELPCTIETADDCLTGGGLFQGEGSSCGSCPPVPPSGACCLGTHCTWTQQGLCEAVNGTYQGNGIQCTPELCDSNPDPPDLTGACCLSEGCEIMTAVVCFQQGGTFKGIGSSCTACYTGNPPGSPPAEWWWHWPPEGCWGEDCGDDEPIEELGEGEDECALEESEVGLNVAGFVDPEDAEYGPQAFCQNCTSGLAVALGRSFRGTMLLTSRGEKLVRIYNHYNDEVKNILQQNPTLRTQAGRTLNDFMPAVRVFLYNDVQGDDFVLDAVRITQIQAVVDSIKLHASDSLASDLDAFMSEVDAQEGKPMSEAIANILQMSP